MIFSPGTSGTDALRLALGALAVASAPVESTRRAALSVPGDSAGHKGTMKISGRRAVHRCRPLAHERDRSGPPRRPSQHHSPTATANAKLGIGRWTTSTLHLNGHGERS